MRKTTSGWLAAAKLLPPSRATRFATLLVITTIVLFVGGAGPALANGGELIYSPDTTTYPNASASYTWAIRLEHSGSANGTVLAAFDNGINTDCQCDKPIGIHVYKSTDDGASWTALSTITDAVHSPGWGMMEPMLYELPQAIGSGATQLAAGTLLEAGLASPPKATPSGCPSLCGADLQVYDSTDHGATWSYLSSCATIPTSDPVEPQQGIWEPDLQVDASGNLVCYFSDERQHNSTPPYNQFIGHVVSTDGGQTWGSEVMDVGAVQGGGAQVRPGMPDVIKLPNGDYFMAFEDCDSNDCQIHYKTSSDGDSWGTASDFGTAITTADGWHLGHTPYVTWSPAGGPNGTLILSGMYLDDSSNNTVAGSGGTVLTNTDLGSGSWQELSAPLTFNYDTVSGASRFSCAGWRPALLPSSDGTSLLEIAPTSIGDNVCEIRSATGDIGSLPFYAPFDHGDDAGWTTFNGSWSVSGGVYSDTATGPDKSIAGSAGWTDYTLQGDVRLDASGQAGFVFRVTNPGDGADADNGYYVGLETSGQTLFVGKQDGSWTTLDGASMTGGVSTGTWYHVTVQVVGCSITVSAQPVTSSSSPTTLPTQTDCSFSAGAIGVRDHYTAASWRNISVTPGGTTSTSTSPYFAPFASGTATGWTTYSGGTWTDSATGETYSDSSPSLGDKSLAGSSSWSDYTLQGDVMLTSSGDAGLILRASNPSTGVDSYDGYWLGIDSSAGKIYLGRSSSTGGYTALTDASFANGVALNTWYHITVQAIGCTLTITAQAVDSFDQAVIPAYTDTGCGLTTGLIGARTHNAGASWRFISVSPN